MGGKNEIVWACEEETRGYLVRRCERLTMDGFRRSRGRPKYWGEIIRYDISQGQLTTKMILERRLWRTWIRIVGG